MECSAAPAAGSGVYASGVDTLALDNPFWAALTTRHRALALGTGALRRYPADCAPFAGIAVADANVDAELAACVAPGETLLFLGVAPHAPRGWPLILTESIAQLVCAEPPALPDGPDIVPLGAGHRADLLALAARVYPHYFRRRTPELGRYFGVRQDGRLAAMIGERLGTDTHTEMSAICTHPDYVGRGYASRLLAFLTRDTFARGHTPFLHVSHANPHAFALYERLGYRVRADLPFWELRRPA